MKTVHAQHPSASGSPAPEIDRFCVPSALLTVCPNGWRDCEFPSSNRSDCSNYLYTLHTSSQTHQNPEHFTRSVSKSACRGCQEAVSEGNQGLISCINHTEVHSWTSPFCHPAARDVQVQVQFYISQPCLGPVTLTEKYFYT